MMNKKTFAAMLALLMIAAVCCACAQAQPATNGSVANDQGTSSDLALSHVVLELPLDNTIGQLYPIHADNFAELEWFTEDRSVAEVSHGRVTPVAEGTTVITCTDGVNTASCRVTICGTADKDYTLRMPANQLSVNVGSTGRVEYTYTGPGAVAVFSSNPGVLRMEDGRWEAVAAGTANITCTDGVKTSQCLVTITDSGSET